MTVQRFVSASLKLKRVLLMSLERLQDFVRGISKGSGKEGGKLQLSMLYANPHT